MGRKFIVSMAVDGRIDVPVTADSAQDAFKKAETAFHQMSLRSMNVVGSQPVNAYDMAKGLLTDY